MNMWKQIGLGSAVLIFCLGVHVLVLGSGVKAFSSLGKAGYFEGGTGEAFVLISAATGVVIVGHTFQVWIWALVFRLLGALSNLSEAVYFALVTTTTLGYGDITLDARFRVTGAMAAVNGLITYGLSTAFLVGVAGGIVESLT